MVSTKLLPFHTISEEEERKTGKEGEEERKVGKEGEGGELIEDLTDDILSELPVKSLLRFKCVCKLWYNLIVSPDFIARHYKNSRKKEVSLYIYSFKSSKVSTDVSFRFYDVPMDLTIPFYANLLEIVSCSNGIVCLSLSRYHEEFVLLNPATKITKKINVSSALGSRHIGFCFDPIVNIFKVVGILLSDIESRAKVSIFTSSSNSFTEKTVDVPCQMCGSYGNSTSAVICVQRYMYWQKGLMGRGWTSEGIYILRFDMIDESFKKIEMPLVNKHCHAQSTLSSYKESIAIFLHIDEVPGSQFDVWLLNDCGTHQSWYKLLTCKTSLVVKSGLGFLSKDEVNLIVLNILTSRDWCDPKTGQTKELPWSEFLLYDPKTGETKKLPGNEYVRQFFSYSESLASVLN